MFRFLCAVERQRTNQKPVLHSVIRKLTLEVMAVPGLDSCKEKECLNAKPPISKKYYRRAEHR